MATVDMVEALTGVTINKFAELNLIGFYELASAFGGVEACINKWPGGGGYARASRRTTCRPAPAGTCCNSPARWAR
jgi:hypothetical protein